MRFHILFLPLMLALTACHDDSRHIGREQFVQEVRLDCTPVKDQGQSSLCWIYATLATIETEHIAEGDSVNLSPDYVARQLFACEATTAYLSRGEKPICQCGMMTRALHLLRQKGVMPYDSYHARQQVNYRALTRRTLMAMQREHTLAAATRAADTVMDNAIDYLPRRVYMLGAEYSPVDFAQSVCRRDEWQPVTSFTHHPFGQKFRLEVPDNTEGDEFLNLSLDQMINLMVRSLRRGHPVCWEGDISEPGFSFARGIADVPCTAARCTQQERQRQFENLSTTDDHCMTIVGIARRHDGKRFFIAKNSWGTDNPYGGYMYLSENYIRLKTIALLIWKS